MRYFFHIGYHGTKYSGWQKHPGMHTVQEVLETALGKLLKAEVNINGCGRTDARVHAAQFFFHADIDRDLDDEFFFRLNKILPDDIAVFEIIPMQGLTHSRFDAIQRTYDYFIHTNKDPFFSGFSSLYLNAGLNLDKIKAAVALLPIYNDYRGFCKMPDRQESTICTISSAGLYASKNGDKIRVEISANRFLSKMVRIIVGRLLEIGGGKMSVDEFEHYLVNKETPKVIIPAYPQGLYLSKVTYPYLNLPPVTTFTQMLTDDINTDWLVI